MTIAEFLTARLDEAEAEWHRHRKNKNIFALPCPNCGNRISSQSVGGPADNGVMLYHEHSTGCFLPMAVWREFADDGPAGAPRDLALIAALRAVVHQHGIGDGAHECPDGFMDSAETEPHIGWEVECKTQRHLATAYADHPDYNPAWKA